MASWSSNIFMSSTRRIVRRMRVTHLQRHLWSCWMRLWPDMFPTPTTGRMLIRKVTINLTKTWLLIHSLLFFRENWLTLSFFLLNFWKQLLDWQRIRWWRVYVVQSCEAVISNCFEIIDKNAKKVLESDEFEDISLELLEDIIKRDGLELPSGMYYSIKCNFIQFYILTHALYLS